MKDMSRKWIVRNFDSSDFPRISSFRKMFLDQEVGSRRRSCEEEYYKWKISKNLALPGEILVAEDGDILVGTTSLTPKKAQIMGQVVTVAEIGDTFTHPNYQRQGIFSTLVNITREQGINRKISIIYGTPNDQSLPGYEKKCNFSKIPLLNVVNVVKPINIKSVLKQKIENPVLRFGGTAIIKIVRTIFEDRSYEIDETNLSTSITDFFPEDTDFLWEQTRKYYDVILVRNKIYLDWRFISNPDHYIILIARGLGAILGYLVVKIGSWNNLKVGYIADFLTISPDIFKTLVARGISLLSNDKIDLISSWVVKNSYYYKIFRRMGFIHYKNIPMICYKNGLGDQIINGQYNWHFTMADSDNI